MLTSLGVSLEGVHAGKWYLRKQDQLDFKGNWHSSFHGGMGRRRGGPRVHAEVSEEYWK